MTFRRFRQAAGAGVVAAALAAAACGDKAQEGRSPAYLVIEQISASAGGSTGEGANYLQSDVITKGTVYEDSGVVEMHVALKDPGTPTSLVDPSPLNYITLDRYRVTFVRADGRNTPGVDVPYPFDGAVTGTVTGGTAKLSFVLVRAQAKLEAPLLPLRGMGAAMLISTIAEVTFYGKDQAGNTVSATGKISVNFADWGDAS